jgi:hypothetical protein
MSSTISRRLAPVRLGILTFGVLMVLIAASVSAPAVVPAHATTADRTVVPAHATTADRTVALTLKCTNTSCSGSWFWRQGGITGTLLGSGSIAGPANTTTKETTTQPAAADTLNFGVHAGSTSGCGRGLIEYFTPGSAINFTATVPSKQPNGIICLGAGSSFNMKS